MVLQITAAPITALALLRNLPPSRHCCCCRFPVWQGSDRRAKVQPKLHCPFPCTAIARGQSPLSPRREECSLEVRHTRSKAPFRQRTSQDLRCSANPSLLFSIRRPPRVKAGECESPPLHFL